MLKKLLCKNESEYKKYELVTRPIAIYCILILIMTMMNTITNTMSPDLINGYFCGLMLFIVISYINLKYIEIKELEKSK